MLAMIVNGSEVKVLNFPIDVATLETLDDWKLVEVLTSDHVLYAEGTIECEDDEQIQRIPRMKIPGLATQNLKEFQRFLVRWIDDAELNGWDKDDAELAASLVNKLDDWKEALNTMCYATKTDVEHGDYGELGEYYFEKWCEISGGDLPLRVRAFVNYEALGEDCDDPELGYWCDIYGVWIDWESCR